MPAIVAFIRAYQAAHGQSPTTTQIAEAVGFGSRGAARYHLTRIARTGALRIYPQPRQAIVLPEQDADVKRSWSLYDQVRAERFGIKPPWEECWAKPAPVRRWVEDELTLARRRRELNEAMDEPVAAGGYGRRAVA